MGKRKGMIREGVALALSLALFSSGMNLSGMSVLAADVKQDDAFNPTVTSEGVAGWNNSNDEQNVTESDQKTVFPTGGNTVASDNDSDKAPWNQIDEPEVDLDENGTNEIEDTKQANGEIVDPETPENTNAGIALLSIVEDVLEADSLEQRISKKIIEAITTNIGTATITIDLKELDINDSKDLKDEELLKLVYQTVLRDCPYDLFWNDQEADDAFATRIQNGTITFEFAIADEYKDISDPTRVDIDKVIAATESKKNVDVIVQDNENKDIKDMLKAYQEEICNLTSYNHTERDKYNANAKDPTLDLNAWQPLYVFDKNADTEVVCEGYSKAFQYLCDKSNLPSNTKCYTVTGIMSGGTGAGGHMWNIVVIDGKSYLVDVTNSDAGSAGDPEYNNGSTPLFLAIPTSGSVEEGYTFKLPNGNTIFYKYDDDTLKLYGKDSSILKLSNTPPTTKPETPKPNPTPTPNPDPGPGPDKDPDWNGKPLPDEDLNPDWMNPDSNPNPDTDMDPNWTDENLTPSGSGSVSSDRNNSGSSSTDDANSGAVNGDVNTGVNNGNNTGNTDNNNVSSNGTGTTSSTQASNTSPKTGDHNAIMFYMVLMLLALGTVGSIYVVRQKRN